MDCFEVPRCPIHHCQSTPTALHPQAVDISQALQQQVYGPLDGHAMEHYMAVAAPTLQQVRRWLVAAPVPAKRRRQRYSAS